jgi:tetratricopeptide (TPR) repeat protein
MPLEVRLRFGRWDEVLAQPEYPDYLPMSRAMRHAARAIAFAAQGKLPEARVEQTALRAAQLPPDATFGNNPSAGILAVARHLADGEIAVREGKLEAGLEELRQAVRAEDELRYDEPPDWIQPVRHTLGAALLDSGAVSEAEAVYLEDLKRWPENVWSLAGLAQSLRAQGKKPGEVDARLRRASQFADVDLSSSCLCLPGRKQEAK